MIITNNLHKKGFALGLVLRQRLAASRTDGLLVKGLYLWPVRVA